MEKKMINGMALLGGIWFSRIVQLNFTILHLVSYKNLCHKDYLKKKERGDDKILLEMVAETIDLKTAQIKYKFPQRFLIHSFEPILDQLFKYS